MLYDNGLGCWRKSTNAEIRKVTQSPEVTNYKVTQRLQWFGHATCRDETKAVKVPIEHQPN